MKKKYYVPISILVLFIIGCSNENEKSENQNNENISGLTNQNEGSLVFQSQFEIGKDPLDPTKVNPNPTRIVNPELQQPDIVGNEGYGTVSTDWEYNFGQKTPEKWNKFQLNYEQGSNNQRFAAIINDPTKSGNRVMQFQVNEANVFIPFPNSGSQYPNGQYKGRVSSEIFSMPSKPSNVKEYYQKIKIYIPKDFEALKASNRPAPSDWLLLNGRVYFAVRPVNAQNNASWIVLCDENKPTVNANNTAPSGYTSWCPMKLYCSKEIVDVFNMVFGRL